MAVAFPIGPDHWGLNLDRCEEILFVDAFLRAVRGARRPDPWQADVERMFFGTEKGLSERLLSGLNERLAALGEEPLAFGPTEPTPYMKLCGDEKIEARRAIRRGLTGADRDRMALAARMDALRLVPAPEGAEWPRRPQAAPAVPRPDAEQQRRRAALEAHRAVAHGAPAGGAPPPETPAPETPAPETPAPETPAPPPAPAAPSAAPPGPDAAPVRVGPADAADQTALLLRLVEMVERLETKVDDLAAALGAEADAGAEVVGGLIEKIDGLGARIGALEGGAAKANGGAPHPGHGRYHAARPPRVTKEVGGRFIFAPGDDQPDL